MLVILTGPLLQRMPLSKKKCFWNWNILENLLILLLRELTPSKTKTKTVLSLSTALYVGITLNQQCVVYEFQCNSSDSNYIVYTSRHLHLHIKEHTYSVIGKHLQEKHNQRSNNLHEQFATLKCRGKFECLIYEMLLIREERLTLNTQNDSIPAKLFI